MLLFQDVNGEKYQENRFYFISFTILNIIIKYLVNLPTFSFTICNAKNKLHCIYRFLIVNSQSVSKEIHTTLTVISMYVNEKLYNCIKKRYFDSPLF